jgi:hypothetical protein
MKSKRKKAPPRKASGDDVVTLRQLCAKYKIDPHNARWKLRRAVSKRMIKHKPRAHWKWEKDDAALSDVRKLLGS